MEAHSTSMQDMARAANTQGDQPEAEVQERLQVCIFELSSRLFALSIFEVQEIKELEETEDITPVPTTPHFLRGVINLRGDIVPIVDIRDVLNLPIAPPTRESRFMILTINTTRLGILVDAIREVTHIEKRATQQLDANQIGIADGQFIANIVQYKEGFLILLDLARLYQAIQL
jgi:purine-binding chemotaxis protein CheW